LKITDNWNGENTSHFDINLDSNLVRQNVDKIVDPCQMSLYPGWFLASIMDYTIFYIICKNAFCFSSFQAQKWSHSYDPNVASTSAGSAQSSPGRRRQVELVFGLNFLAVVLKSLISSSLILLLNNLECFYLVLFRIVKYLGTRPMAYPTSLAA